MVMKALCEGLPKEFSLMFDMIQLRRDAEILLVSLLLITKDFVFDWNNEAHQSISLSGPEDRRRLCSQARGRCSFRQEDHRTVCLGLVNQREVYSPSP
jgi:hypothetical protein